MKYLILMRHAKALKESTDGDDFSRTLDERGKSDASYMCQLLVKSGYIPNLVVSSPAKRTRKTAEIAIRELGIKEKNLQLDTSIYEAGISDLVHIIRELEDQSDCVMLIGHNPSITGIVGHLTPSFVQHVPTSGIVVVEMPITTWKMTRPQIGKVVWFKNPKGTSL